MIQLNIIALTHLTKLLIPYMLEKSYGKILNLGSVGSFTPGPLNAVYCATKAYVLSFSEAISEELKGTGVTVTTLCPGVTETNFARKADIENTKLFKNCMKANKVAKIGYEALMKEKSYIVPGKLNKLTVFALRFLPRKNIARMVKNMMEK